MPDLYEFVRNFGFPGAVALFVLWRLDRRLHEVAEQVAQLRVDLARLLALLPRPPPTP